MEVGVRGKNGYALANLNRRKAIHKRCLDCTGWKPSGVRRCPFI
jgi:hypothetical protein